MKRTWAKAKSASKRVALDLIAIEELFRPYCKNALLGCAVTTEEVDAAKTGRIGSLVPRYRSGCRMLFHGKISSQLQYHRHGPIQRL